MKHEVPGHWATAANGQRYWIRAFKTTDPDGNYQVRVAGRKPLRAKISACIVLALMPLGAWMVYYQIGTANSLMSALLFFEFLGGGTIAGRFLMRESWVDAAKHRAVGLSA